MQSAHTNWDERQVSSLSSFPDKSIFSHRLLVDTGKRPCYNWLHRLANMTSQDERKAMVNVHVPGKN